MKSKGKDYTIVNYDNIVQDKGNFKEEIELFYSYFQSKTQKTKELNWSAIKHKSFSSQCYEKSLNLFNENYKNSLRSYLDNHYQQYKTYWRNMFDFNQD